MPLTVAVVERPDGLVLLDVGWSRRTCAWPERDPGRARKLFLGLDVKPEDAIASQLLSLGYTPGDVRHIVATHLHIDHVGGAVDFPLATVHCAEREWREVERGKTGYDPRTLCIPRLERHALAGPPMLGFDASHDLFGDGTVLLLDARGHTAGSMAVAVKLHEGWAVHVGDAAMFADDARNDHLPPSLYMRAIAWQLAAQRETFGRLRVCEAEHGGRLVPSHDPAVFETLPHTRETAWPTAWTRRPQPRRSR
jgi:glyoxylase-like metal-dependent hydrolase (beta-lactamase superfamily II)